VPSYLVETFLPDRSAGGLEPLRVIEAIPSAEETQ